MFRPKFSFLGLTVFKVQANQVSYNAQSVSQCQFIYVPEQANKEKSIFGIYSTVACK